MISAIVCSASDARFANCQATLTRAMGHETHEIIRIADARSMCEGYNRGIAQSKGDVLLFCHDDIEILCPDLCRRLRDHLSRCDVLGVAGTMRLTGPSWSWAGPPYLYGQLIQWAEAEGKSQVAIFSAPSPHVTRMQAMDGVFLAAHRPIVEAIGFDEQTFTDFHHYDLDFTFRASQAGYKLAVACDLDLVHHSEGNFDQRWQRSADAFMKKHAARLGVLQPPAKWTRTGVRVSDRAEAVQLLHPPHWQGEGE